MTHLPTIVIIGRRNVGKSALFNRLIEETKAIVSEIAGTTRDRTEGVCRWRGYDLRVVDTGGLDIGEADTLEREIRKQTKFALKKADLILFLVDARVGPTPADVKLAKELHSLVEKRSAAPRVPPSGGQAPALHLISPVLLVANKAETQKWREAAQAPEWKRLRLNTPFPISAATGQGVGDLLDEMFKRLPLRGTGAPSATQWVPKPDLRIAIIGKPNVGKSSLLNKILGEERVIVSPIPHTTREPQDTRLDFKDKHILLVDTAGIRKKAKIEPGMEKAGVDKTWNMLKRSEIAIFVIDGKAGIDEQDKHLAGLIHKEGAGVIIVVNKWDIFHQKNVAAGLQPARNLKAVTTTAIKTKAGDTLMKQIHFGLPGLTFAPVVFISALTGHGVQKLLPIALNIQQNRQRIIPDDELKKLLPKLILRHKPTKGKGTHHPVIRSIEQTATEPPTFAVTIGPKQSLHESYLRYLENRLREFYDFEGTPLKIWVKQSKN